MFVFNFREFYKYKTYQVYIYTKRTIKYINVSNVSNSTQLCGYKNILRKKIYMSTEFVLKIRARRKESELCYMMRQVAVKTGKFDISRHGVYSALFGRTL